MAAREYAKAVELLAGGSLLDAAREYCKRNLVRLPSKAVNEVVTEFLAVKRQEGMSDAYLNDIQYRGGKLAAAMQLPIARIDGALLREFMTGLKLSARSHNNFARCIGTIFEFAKSRGYLPKDFDALESVSVMKLKNTGIDIFTPEEIAKLLQAAPSQFLPGSPSGHSPGSVGRNQALGLERSAVG